MTIDRRDFLAGTAGLAASLSLAGCGRRAERADVVVIGAGLAGLHAARLLQREGAAVLLLEGSDRVGGRVQTLFDAPGAPEIGAADIGTIYHRVQAAVADLGLEIEEWPGGMPSYLFMLRDEVFTAKQWPQLDINSFEGKLRKVNPSGMAQFFLPRPNPLSDLQAWLTDNATQYDVPLDEFLLERGATADALSYVQIGQQFDDLGSISALGLMRAQRFALTSMETAFAEGKPIRYLLKGGMSLMTERMAASVGDRVRLEHRVTSIEHDSAGVRVACANGARIDADFAVCTAPLPLVRDIGFAPALPPQVAAAVEQIPYGEATSIMLNVKKPFWEDDGLPPNMWTDLPIDRVFLMPSPIGEGDHLWVFTTGRADLARSGLSNDEMARFAIAELEKARPSAKGLLEPLGVRSWTTDPTCRGTYSSLGPGQAKPFGAIWTEPVGRLYFAGEHTSIENLGMEGAMESGERAARGIIERQRA